MGITVFESVTLDGVMQAPGRADEDTRGGFAHGGWAAGYQDEVAMAFAGDATETVADLRRRGADLTVLGSGELVRALHGAGLVDELVLQIHPVALGSGTTLFGSGPRRDLTLTRSVVTTTGVIIAQYSAH